jgi:pimeloyl-ACP methyl ester carboxylesterase
MQVDRRAALQTFAIGGAALGVVSPAAPSRAAVPAPAITPRAPPARFPTQDAFIDVDGARLWTRDTGGDGPVVVLLHPASGSALVWDYQLPALAAAGYRVVAYSRRGHHGSDPTDRQRPSAPAEDLALLADRLGVARFSVVAAAAGCSVALDFAISHPDRLKAAVFSCGAYGGLDEPEYAAARRNLHVKGFEDMPPAFRELGPSYRAVSPEGVKAWAEIERGAVTGERSGVRSLNKANWSSLAKIDAPCLFIAGAADLDAPPALMRLVAERVRAADMIVMPECGHSPHWEAPDLFNDTVIRFLRAHD